MPLILNQSQAEAVYSAMCALNNVGAEMLVQFTGYPRAQDHIGIDASDGSVRIRVGMCGDFEGYQNQAAFATAYGLKQG
jgi:hypothetical protein